MISFQDDIFAIISNIFFSFSYLMGEEGYCLTTLNAAISYLMTMKKSVHGV